jgi:hypothetical protein
VNPTLSGIASTLVGVSVPLVLKAGVIAVLLVPLLWKGSTPQEVLLNGSLFLIVAILVNPNDFFLVYMELPIVTLMVWSLSSSGSAAPFAVNP